MIRKDIKTRKLANGSELSIPVFHFSGTDASAPSAYIQASVHAAEVQGYIVALSLIEHFTKHPPKGDVTIIPFANPYGLNCKVGEYTLGRFDPVTGDNWNRNYLDLSSLVKNFLIVNKDCEFASLIPMFKEVLRQHLTEKLQEPTSYHKKLALQLQTFASSADIVLDLHCDAISVPHIYSATYAMGSVSSLEIPFVVEIPPIFAGALDEAIFCPWIELTKQYHELYPDIPYILPPVEAFTIEFGNQEQIKLQDSYQQSKGILRYLSTKGVSEQTEECRNSSFYSCKLADFLNIYAPIGGLIIDNATVGTKIKAGQNLMILSSPSLFDQQLNVSDLIKESSSNIVITQDAILIAMVASAIVHEGMALMKVMTNYQLMPSS